MRQVRLTEGFGVICLLLFGSRKFCSILEDDHFRLPHYLELVLPKFSEFSIIVVPKREAN
jgi:hypothetical protein